MKAHTEKDKSLRSRFSECMNGVALEDTVKEETTKNEEATIHSPKKMIDFLSLFSRDDRFKWYTHKWDMTAQFDIDSLVDRQPIDKKVLTEMVYPKNGGEAVNEETYNQVWNFINFSKAKERNYPWKNNKLSPVRYGWGDIVESAHDHPDIPVESLKLPDEHQFKDYIRMFKAVIEFRTDLEDGDRFSELVWNYLEDGLPKDFDLTFSTNFDDIGYDVNVYCDVAAIMSALTTVINWIVSHKATSSKVSVDLTSEKGYYILEILHADSYFNNMEKLKNPSGDFASLRRRLFSVCDFFMTGDYMKDGQKQGSLKVIGLNEKVKKTSSGMTACEIVSLEEQIGGVKYQFKIYKR